MNSLLLKLAITATVCTLLSSNPTAAQILPPAKRAERVEITKGPALEGAREDFAIIGGSPTTLGVRTFISLSCNTVRIPRT